MQAMPSTTEDDSGADNVSEETIYVSLFTLAGRIFINEVDSDFIDLLKTPDMMNVLEKLQPGFQDYLLNNEWHSTDLELLAADYCELFILPDKNSLSLQASHWLNEELFDTDKLEQLINEYLQPEAIPSIGVNTKLPNDHLGLLLYFIAALYNSKDPDVRQCGRQTTDYFLKPWIAVFVDKLSNKTKNPIYLAGGQLLLTLLK